MSQASPTAREKILYKDFFTVYQQVLGSDGNPVGYTIPTRNGILMQNISCSLHMTPNEDVYTDVRSKVENIFTLNRVTTFYDVQILADDYCTLTDRWGSYLGWMAVGGQPKKRSLIPHQQFYGAPTGPPGAII